MLCRCQSFGALFDTASMFFLDKLGYEVIIGVLLASWARLCWCHLYGAVFHGAVGGGERESRIITGEQRSSLMQIQAHV